MSEPTIVQGDTVEYTGAYEQYRGMRGEVLETYGGEAVHAIFYVRASDGKRSITASRRFNLRPDTVRFVDGGPDCGDPPKLTAPAERPWREPGHVRTKKHRAKHDFVFEVWTRDAEGALTTQYEIVGVGTFPTKRKALKWLKH